MPANCTVERQLPVSLKDINTSTGTWTYTNSTGLITLVKTDADNTPVLTFPLLIPRRNDQFGVKLKSVKVPLKCATAALEAAPTCAIYRNDYDAVVAGATGDAAAVSVEVTDDGVVTADANYRLLTITVDDPDFDYTTEALCVYVVSITFDAATTSALSIGFPIAIYEELT